MSEIVGALMLVVVVSSAAFGFGMFLHQQSKLTQEAKAAEQALRLEKVAIPALANPPLDLTDACDGTPLAGPGDGSWDTLSFRVTSEHLQASTVTALRVNGLTVHRLELTPFDGSNTLSFESGDVDHSEFVLDAHESIVVKLVHAACPDGSGLSPFYAPATPIATTAALQLELVTGLGNHVERAFVPPTAVIVLGQQGSAATSYILDGSSSETSNQDGFLVTYAWTVVPSGGDGEDDDGTKSYGGRRALASGMCDDVGECYDAVPDMVYAVTLTVTDNFGMTGSATFPVTL